MGYSVNRIITKDQLDELREFETKIPWDKTENYYNLYALYKYNQLGPRWLRRSLEEYYNKKIHVSYFLKYVTGSYTIAHRDDTRVSESTAVTFIKTTGLVGGESIIYESVPNKKDKKDHWMKPVVIPNLGPGKTLLYDTAQTHSVAKVHRGERTVHICWFKRED